MDNENHERHNYLNSALRWSIKVSPEHRAGHPQLHKKCGLLFWQGTGNNYNNNNNKIDNFILQR